MDPGARNHITWSKKGVRMCMSPLFSLGHTGEAIEYPALVDIPGIFVSKTRDAGLRAVLKECS